MADMCLVAWPAKIAPSTEPRHQYVHAVDVVPTIYDLLDIDPPQTLKGYKQSPIEGESFAASLTDPAAQSKTTQFYTMLGQRSIYHEGWLACTVHPPLSGWASLNSMSGSFTTLRTTAPSRRTLQRKNRNGLNSSRRFGLSKRQITTAYRSTTAPPWSRPWPIDRAAHPSATGTSTTRTARQSRNNLV